MHGHLNTKFLKLYLCKMTWNGRYVEASHFFFGGGGGGLIDEMRKQNMPERLVVTSQAFVWLLHPLLHNIKSGYNSGSKMGSRGQGTCLLKNKHNYLIRSVAGSRVSSTRTQLCLLFPVFSLHWLYTVSGLKYREKRNSFLLAWKVSKCLA